MRPALLLALVALAVPPVAAAASTKYSGTTD
jgi:hypothetical protein